MAKRSARDFEANMEQQLKSFKPVKVNPFPLMMDASRQHSQQHVAAQPSGRGLGVTTAAPPSQPCTLCSHCGVGLTELQVQQCHACKSVYCSSCSVINYDAREDRIFCLDCHSHHTMQFNSNMELELCSSYQQDNLCSPSSANLLGNSSAYSAGRRSSLLHACNRAAVAATAVADGGNSSCMAAMAGLGGLVQQQSTPLLASNGVCGFGRGSNGRMLPSVLGQWDLNSPPLTRANMGQQLLSTSPVLPFTGNGRLGYEGLTSQLVGAASTGC